MDSCHLDSLMTLLVLVKLPLVATRMLTSVTHISLYRLGSSAGLQMLGKIPLLHFNLTLVTFLLPVCSHMMLHLLETKTSDITTRLLTIKGSLVMGVSLVLTQLPLGLKSLETLSTNYATINNNINSNLPLLLLEIVILINFHEEM